MAKTKKAKAVETPITVPKLTYNLHLGKLIKDYVKNHPTLTETEIAEKISIHKQSFGHRTRNPTYGSGYQLIEISLLLKKDFISPMLEVLHNNGIFEETKFSTEDMDNLKKDVAHYKELWERSKKEIDVLHKLIDTKK